jgi:hypothetical protein
MSASKRTSIRLENVITISPLANNDDMLCCAFACYSANRAIRRTCKTLDAYFAMPSTIDALAAENALGAYGQWEYRALKFDADKFFPTNYPTICDTCNRVKHLSDNLSEWIKHDWPVPSAMERPPASSPRLLRLFKHLVDSRGLYYFFHRSNLYLEQACRCNGPYPHDLANKYCMHTQILFGYTLCGTISTEIPSYGIKLRYSFRFVHHSEFAWCEIQTTARVDPDGSPQSAGIDTYKFQAFDMPFDINERPLHQHNWKLLEMPSEVRPAFATDTMLGYIAFMLLRRMSRRITVKHRECFSNLMNLCLGLGQMKEYINNAKLGPYEYDSANVSTSGLYKSNHKRAYV